MQIVYIHKLYIAHTANLLQSYRQNLDISKRQCIYLIAQVDFFLLNWFGFNACYMVSATKKNATQQKMLLIISDLVCAQTRMALETKSAQKSHFETTRVTLKTPTI